MKNLSFKVTVRSDDKIDVTMFRHLLEDELGKFVANLAIKTGSTDTDVNVEIPQ